MIRGSDLLNEAARNRTLKKSANTYEGEQFLSEIGWVLMQEAPCL